MAANSGATKGGAAKSTPGKLGRIYVGIGGWNFEPWRGVFCPKIMPLVSEC